MWEEQRPWNVYHYSANNPIVLKDPNGEAPVGATPTDHTPRYEDPMRNGAGGDPKSGSSGGGKVRSAVQRVIRGGGTVGESTPQQEEARNRREAQSQVQINNTNGKAFEQKVVTDQKTRGNAVAEQVSIRSGGKRMVVDVATTKDGGIHLIEAKSSQTARLSKNQHHVIESIMNGNPAILVGTKGARIGLEAGTVLDVRSISIARPDATGTVQYQRVFTKK